MPKKIYDVVPPKANSVKIRRIQKPPVQDTLIERTEPVQTVQAFATEAPRAPYLKRRRFPVKEVFIGGFVILLLCVFYFASTLGKAEIQIQPKLDTITLEGTLTADKAVTTVDIQNRIIPTQYIEQSQDSWQEFEATGVVKNASKAAGTIKIYNNISPSAPFSLKVGTHFLSDSGKYFMTLEKVTIPAGKKNQPGSIEVKVEAKESGPEHNIDASKFSVPKLSGTEYYYNIWGESTDTMVGGSTGNAKQVTQDDIDKAKDTLNQHLLAKALEELKHTLTGDDVLLDGAILKDVLESKPEVKANAIIDKFTVSSKVKVSALVFKKTDVKKLIEEDIKAQLSSSQTYLDNSIEVSFDPELIDVHAGVEKLHMRLSTRVYSMMDISYLASVSGRKSADEIRQVIESKYGDRVSSIRINFWPIWVKKAPSDQDKIKIDLKFE